MAVDINELSRALSEPIDGKTSLEDALNDNKFYDGVYLFFSFDLVNSTSFKSQYKNEWKTVFTRFYEFVSAKLTKAYKDISIWKYIGDEVLLYLKITNIEQVYDAPINALKVIEEVTKELYDYVEVSRNRVFIKSTLWIAKVNYLESSGGSDKQLKNTYKNIAFPSGDLPDWLDQQRIDFLGPDIDLGFRLSQFTQKGKLLISAELAFILYRKNGEVNRSARIDNYKYKPNEFCKILTLKQLKGIWSNRRYPIIWFSRAWDNIFDYDEHLESDLVKIVLEGKVKTLEENIEKIFSDLGKTEEIEEIIRLIENPITDETQKLVRYNISQDRLAEVHCAAICFDSEGKMLVAKRPENKSRLKGFWEFGCGQLEMNQDIKTCLKKNYKKDFNADLYFLGDHPIPITTYTVKIEEEDRVVPGILFLAIIENSVQIKDTFNTEKHVEIRWLTEEELDSIPQDKAVPDFRQSAELAFNAFKANQHLLEKVEL